MLDEIETRLTWRPNRDMDLRQRVRNVGAGLLALKELQYLGRTQDGTIAERIARLIDAILTPLETEWVNGHNDGHAVVRVKAPVRRDSAGHDQERPRRTGKSPPMAIA